MAVDWGKWQSVRITNNVECHYLAGYSLEHPAESVAL